MKEIPETTFTANVPPGSTASGARITSTIASAFLVRAIGNASIKSTATNVNVSKVTRVRIAPSRSTLAPIPRVSMEALAPTYPGNTGSRVNVPPGGEDRLARMTSTNALKTKEFATTEFAGMKPVLISVIVVRVSPAITAHTTLTSVYRGLV